MGKYWKRGKFFIKALEDNGIDYDYIPTDKMAEKFPWAIEELKAYHVVVLSDVADGYPTCTPSCCIYHKVSSILDRLPLSVR